MSVASGCRVALSAGLTATALTADFAPVPYLGPAVGIVIGILQLCDNVRVNKQEVNDLGGRCQNLLYALKENSDGLQPESLQTMTAASESLLGDIKQRMEGWNSHPGWKQFLLQNEIREDIKHCLQAIESFLESFNVTSHLEIHRRMGMSEERAAEYHQEVIAYLSDISHKQEIQLEAIRIMQSGGIEPVRSYMGTMQEQLGVYPVGDFRHNGLQQNLYGVQQATGELLPKVELRRGEVRRVSTNPVGGSAAFDIWVGEYLGSEKCAIKVVRGIEVSPKIRQRFLRETEIWRKVWELDQGNYMLPFWGACLTDGPYPYMVSPWMEYGDATSFVNKYPDVNRKKIVRRIAEGLRLLHTYQPPIAHGDIKGANILINNDGNPLLADFGLSKMMEDLTGMPFTQSRGVSESYRWFAPELCSAPGVLSPASDVFAYSMTVLELMTGQQPFSHIKRTPEVLIKMQQGERPRKPDGQGVIDRGLDDRLWNLLERCWVAEPEQRPTIHEVLAELSEA